MIARQLPDDLLGYWCCRRLGVVMVPDGSSAQAEGVLNPGVVRGLQRELLLYPRMVAAGNESRIGLVRVSESGAFERLGTVLEPEQPYERREIAGGRGCEDARVTFMPDLGNFVMAYTAFGPTGARIAVAISRNGYQWTRLGLVNFPDDDLNAVDNKDAAFFPEIVWSPAGIPSFAFFHRPMRPETINGQTPIELILRLRPHERESVRIAYVPADRVKRDIGALCAPVESARAIDVGTTWGRLKNGAGTPPIRTRFGWLSVFHGVDVVDGSDGPSLFYSAGVVIHDVHSPHKLVYRSPHPILIPETNAERIGTVNNVVFPTGIDPISEDAFDIYYGAADAKISRARVERLR
jgi:predicted GH43/DUF377 family glycosyl hydrolase